MAGSKIHLCYWCSGERSVHRFTLELLFLQLQTYLEPCQTSETGWQGSEVASGNNLPNTYVNIADAKNSPLCIPLLGNIPLGGNICYKWIKIEKINFKSIKI